MLSWYNQNERRILETAWSSSEIDPWQSLKAIVCFYSDLNYWLWKKYYSS